MKKLQFRTTSYKHEYYFTFNGHSYLVNSYVKLTKYGKEYLEATSDKILLTEHFYMPLNGKEVECWKFIVRYDDVPPRPFTMSTNEPLDKLIDEVIEPVKNISHAQSKNIPSVDNKDLEVPDVLLGWVLVVVFFVAVEVFKDWGIKLILRVVVGWCFGLWRQKRMLEEGMIKLEKEKEGNK